MKSLGVFASRRSKSKCYTSVKWLLSFNNFYYINESNADKGIWNISWVLDNNFIEEIKIAVKLIWTFLFRRFQSQLNPLRSRNVKSENKLQAMVKSEEKILIDGDRRNRKHTQMIEMYEGLHASHVVRISSGPRSSGMLLAFRFENK